MERADHLADWSDMLQYSSGPFLEWPIFPMKKEEGSMLKEGGAAEFFVISTYILKSRLCTFFSLYAEGCKKCAKLS